MSDVACVCCAPLVAEVRARGIDPDRLVEGLPLSLSQLESPLRRVPWDPFREFAHRASELLGGFDELEEVAARAAPEAVPHLLRRLLPHLGSARPIYFIGARWWGPWIFRGTRATCEALADGRLREVIEILPEYGECPEFFQGLRGVIRAMPRLFNQPDAVVDLSQDGRRGEYVITAPPSRRRGRWLGAHWRTGMSPLPDDLEELGFRQEQLRDALRRTRATSALLADRTRRLETVHRFGAELVWHRETRTRIEGVIRLLQDHLPLRAIRIWYEGSRTGRSVELTAAGEIEGRASIARSLQVGGRRVGRLELWTSGPAELSQEAEALLDEALPWLALALDAARADEELRGLRARLEEDLADWHRAERRLETLLGSAGQMERAAGRQVATRDEGEPAHRLPVPLQEDGGEGEAVLLVESQPARRTAARWALEAAGYRVVEAADLAEAMAVFERGFDPVGLLLTDLARPSFDLELARRALEPYPGLRGVLLLRLQHP